jgi:TonB family protein
MVLPVRVWLDDGTDQSADAQLAHTLDITQVGAMVGGLHSSFKAGENIVVQRGQFKARFRVVWTKPLGRGELRAGIEAIDPDRNIWGVDLPPESINPNDDATPQKTAAGASDITKTAQAANSRVSQSRAGHPVFPKSQAPRRWMTAVGGVAAVLALASVLMLLQHMQRQDVSDGMSASQIPQSITVPSLPADDVAEERPPAATLISAKRVSVTKEPPPLRLQVSDPPKGFPLYPTSPDPILRGKVELKLLIGKNGHVSKVHVTTGNRVLAEAAIQAVKQWRYDPFELNGQPVEAESNIVVSFMGEDAVSITYPPVNTSSLAVYRPAQLTQISTQ